MCRLGVLSTILAALSVAAVTPVLAQQAVQSVEPAGPGGNVSALGRKMPPTTGRASASQAGDSRTAGAKAPDKPSTEAEMLKAQKAAEERNKAWDGKMRKTMGSICSGC